MAHWGILWRSDNKLDGRREYLYWIQGNPCPFATRRACRKYIKERFGYIKGSNYLKAEPHGWKMPIPVKVTICWE